MDYSETIKLKNGDLFFDSLGKLKLITREEKIIQSVRLIIQTVKGELFYNDEYGLDLYSIRKLDKEVLEALLKDAIVDDEVIIDLRLINFTIDEERPGVINTEMELYLMDGEIITVQFADEEEIEDTEV